MAGWILGRTFNRHLRKHGVWVAVSYVGASFWLRLIVVQYQPTTPKSCFVMNAETPS
ncbi:hypothetical protein BofuT4_uP044900.1 [Botrytis cinerea T4]|uniref:Uncharacterized protein n=1 Tax=Botryotinia fuckeliana (strain T4) TaxID=999810 RepID=G2XYD5_BOTF4|nr:hypothetical protein BofuT4_uP044900.1 [Botrytis cinerea T4]